MNKKKLANILLFCNCILLACVVCFIPYTTISLFAAKDDYTDQGKYPGQIGLRSYFQEGIGTEEKPYVISRPVHFYNLTRLQNLGVFTTKTYFSLGYDADKTDSDTSLKFYENNSSTTQISYLDMRLYSGSNALLSIGSEGTPFYGDFDGNGLVVKNLTVRSGPEDVGVFGYTYTGSNVHDVFFQDLKVVDDGYDESINQLSDLFADTNTDVGGLTYNSSTITKDESDFTDLTQTFTATMPTTPSLAKFELRSSSEYLSIGHTGDTWTATINPTDGGSSTSTSIFDNSTFTEGSGNRISVRLSIVGTLYETSTGISYSKVLSTYLVTFTNKIVDSASVVTFKARLDYVDATVDSYTQYAHGVNIGYLIGHCDGSASKCFVYNGELSLNNSVTGYHAMAQETETGLIGEIGPAILNEYGKKFEAIQSGDTGVINFTKMYEDVVGDGTFTQISDGYSYDPITDNVFKEYLRNTHQTPAVYFTSIANSFDFAGRQIIKDTDDVDRGLGVFSLATDSLPSETYDHRLQGLGNFSVINKSKSSDVVKSFTDFYYTTAEYDQDPTTSTSYITDWNESSTGDNRMVIGREIPTDVDTHTWTSDFEKHYNYIFKVSLESSISNGVNNTDYPNYFSGTTNSFLQNYFNYKLINKSGTVPAYTDKDYGVFIKNVNKNTKVTSNIEEFTSYLKLTSPGDSNVYTILDTQDGIKVPTDTINFSIKSEYGANVTVMASSTNGTGGYVSIYNKDVTLEGDFADSSKNKHPALHPSYTMFCKYNGSVRDENDYFEYDSTNKTLKSNTTTANHITNTPNADRLYCHTFKLPKGNYFISSPNGSAYIYYVCAQGQGDSGNYGNQSNVYSQLNSIKDIDFIGRDPSASGYVYDDTDRCKVAMKGTFSSATGTFKVESLTQVKDGTSVTDNPLKITSTDNLELLYIVNTQYYTMTLNGTASTDQYITYTKGG